MEDVSCGELRGDVDILRGADDGRVAGSGAEADDGARGALGHHRAERSGLRVDWDAAMRNILLSLKRERFQFNNGM